MKITISQITDELHKAYNLLNERFFDKKLPIVALTIQAAGNRSLSMGWCTQEPIWSDKEGNIKMYEINISAEFLRMPFIETMDTLMHEMVHLYNLVNGIKDTSRSGTYHNKSFKDSAIKHGFEFTHDKPDKKYGFSFVSLSEETKKVILDLPINQELFRIARKAADVVSEENTEEATEIKEIKERKKTFRWICTECDQVIRSTKPDIKVICGRCRVDFVCTDE